MEQYSDLWLGVFLAIVTVWILAGALFAHYQMATLVDRHDHRYMWYVIFWPFYLGGHLFKRFWLQARSLWRHASSPKPPNRTKA